jgi:hypothetical protein
VSDTQVWYTSTYPALPIEPLGPIPDAGQRPPVRRAASPILGRLSWWPPFVSPGLEKIPIADRRSTPKVLACSINRLRGLGLLLNFQVVPLNLFSSTDDATNGVSWCRRGGCTVALQESFLKYADWLLARALTLRESGNVEAAEKYVQRALECLDKADKQEQAKKE